MKIFISIILLFAIVYGIIGFFGSIETNHNFQPKRAAEEDPYEEETEGGLRYSDVPVYKDKRPSPLAYVNRTYKLFDGRGREYRINYALPKTDVVETERRYGYSKSELFEVLNTMVENWNEEYSGMFHVTLHRNLDYRIEGNYDYDDLSNKFHMTFDHLVGKHLRAHLIAIEDNIIGPDYRAIQMWQAAFLKELYDNLILLAHKNKMNQRDWVKLMASLVQNLQYRIPPITSNGKEIFGFWPPIICLYEKAGDCDSKSTLFATLFYHYRKNSCILLMTKRHAFIGIRNMHKVSPADYSVKIGGVDYILLETTSPERIGYIGRKSLDKLRKRQFSYILFH